MNFCISFFSNCCADPQLLHDAVNYLLTALVIVAAIPVFGGIMQVLTDFLYRICRNLLGNKAAFFIFNRLTFPGVAHHELSHALSALLTGARVTKIALFKPEGNRLGYVEFVPRGIFLFRAIQMTMTSAAPVYCGALSVSGLFYMICQQGEKIPWWGIGLLVYLMFSIILHMTMSRQDLKNMWKGIPVCYLIVFAVLVVTKYTL